MHERTSMLRYTHIVRLVLAADGFSQLHRRVCLQPGKEPEVPTEEGTGWSTV